MGQSQKDFQSTGGLGRRLTDKLFTGQRLDATGLYYYNARYYDPSIGRFISADTIVPDPANPQSFNRYTYCLNNPLKYIDPDGHFVITASAAVISGLCVVGLVGFYYIGVVPALERQGVDTSINDATSYATDKVQKTVKNIGSAVGGFFNNLFPGDDPGKSERDKLLEQVSNKKLINAIKQIYKKNAKIGDGGTADAIRYELQTGQQVGGKWHIQKGFERISNLQKILRTQKLTPTERQIAQDLLDNLLDALEGVAP